MRDTLTLNQVEVKVENEKHENQDVVLVADDEANNRFLLKTHLEAAGYRVVLTTNGVEALESIQADPPGVIILDVMMPEMDGYTVCRQVKSSSQTMAIPVIMVTALRGTDERIRGIEAGADDFISKPFNRMELVTRVKSLLRIRKLNEALEQKIIELERAKEKLRQLAITDGLTGIYNHRYFRRQLKLEISRAKRFNMPFSLVMYDLDHFKNYNDQFGHLNGDKVLKRFARILYEHIREVDTVARYGGEEFVLLLPGTNKDSALMVAEKIRLLVSHSPFPHAKKLQGGKVTVSAGVATWPEDAVDGEDLIIKTDQALYKAKNAGRNKTIASP